MTHLIEAPVFSAAVERALRTALAAHAGQARKSETEVPYIAHPVHVALMLARLGMDDDAIQAGLLHDVVEDCPPWTLAGLEEQFGERVARIVGELTEDKSKGWDERKQTAIDHAPRMSPEAAAIKACDKLHNLQCLLADLRAAEDPGAVWGKFRGGRAATLTMARGLVDALASRVRPPLGAALRTVMDELEAEAG